MYLFKRFRNIAHLNIKLLVACFSLSPSNIVSAKQKCINYFDSEEIAEVKEKKRAFEAAIRSHETDIEEYSIAAEKENNLILLTKAKFFRVTVCQKKETSFLENILVKWTKSISKSKACLHDETLNLFFSCSLSIDKYFCCVDKRDTILFLLILGSGSVFIAAFIHIFITLIREVLFTSKHFSQKSSGKVLQYHIKIWVATLNKIKCAQELFVKSWKRSTVSLRTPILLCSQHVQSFIQKSLVFRISWVCKSNVDQGSDSRKAVNSMVHPVQLWDTCSITSNPLCSITSNVCLKCGFSYFIVILGD